MQKNKKNKRDEIILQDMNLAKTTKARVKQLVFMILKEKPLLSEKDLLIELYTKDKVIKSYIDNNPKKITYLRYVIWEMVKRGEIIKAKAIGDMRRSYYLLPSQIGLIRDKIIKIPKKWEKLLQTKAQEKARGEAQTKASEEEDWDEEDWEELEELKEEAKEEDWDEDDIEDWDEE